MITNKLKKRKATGRKIRGTVLCLLNVKQSNLSKKTLFMYLVFSNLNFSLYSVQLFLFILHISNISFFFILFLFCETFHVCFFSFLSRGHSLSRVLHSIIQFSSLSSTSFFLIHSSYLFLSLYALLNLFLSPAFSLSFPQLFLSL